MIQMRGFGVSSSTTATSGDGDNVGRTDGQTGDVIQEEKNEEKSIQSAYVSVRKKGKKNPALAFLAFLVHLLARHVAPKDLGLDPVDNDEDTVASCVLCKY